MAVGKANYVVVFNDTATTEIYTLSLHDALPIWLPGRPGARARRGHRGDPRARAPGRGLRALHADRKSTRLNSSHANISYAVFCLKKNKPAPRDRPHIPSANLLLTVPARDPSAAV